MSMKEFQIQGRLGEGAYSSVFKVRRLHDKTEYALKKVKMGKLSAKEKENALNEVRILASIEHPNVIGYREVFFEDATSSLCLVMDYADGGDVYQKITQHQKAGTLFPQAEIWAIFIQIVKGLQALHKRKILHRDMKSANIFLCKNGIAKLGDLNVSKVAKKGLLYTQTGTPYYASPEVWKDLPYDERSDIWSLGCVLYEIISLKPPFRANDMQGLYKKVTRGQYSRLPSQYSSELAQMVAQLLQCNARMRPSCRGILEMPSVQKRMQILPSATSPLSQSVNLLDTQTLGGDINLLGTIKVPRNLLYLGERLPKPNYNRNLSVPNKLLPQVHTANPELERHKESLGSKQEPRGLEQNLRKQLHDKVSAVLDDVTEKNIQEKAAKKAMMLKNQKLLKQLDTANQKYIHRSKKPSGVYPGKLDVTERIIKSRESENPEQENRADYSRKKLPPRVPDRVLDAKIRAGEEYDDSGYPRALKRPGGGGSGLYSRVYGGGIPQRYGYGGGSGSQDLKLPNIRGGVLSRHQGGGSNSVNPLIRGGASISQSKRVLLEELDPSRKNAISVLPPSRGSYARDARMQHISLDQGPSPKTPVWWG